MEGDCENAALAGFSMIPFVGWAGTGLKWGAKKSPEVSEWLGKIFKRCNSFVGDTPVLTADGTTKPIRDVQVGDEVLATDPTTGETAAREVTDLITGTGDKDLVKVTVDTDGATGDRTDVLTSTAGHPFWVTNRGAWLDAKDLAPGDDLRRIDGSSIEVVATTKWTEHTTVYNFTVDGIHTYYVKAAVPDSPEVLVHNSGRGR